MLKLSRSQIGAVVRSCAADFRSFVDRYDERKYPAAELKRLRSVFGRPQTVTPMEIEAALVWKYGHTGKANYPASQRRLARRIATWWATDAIAPGENAATVLERWQHRLGSTSFITVCFFLHLANPRTWPILDQHNFRSVTFHLGNASGRREHRKLPRRVEDLTLVRDFIRLVRGNWQRCTNTVAPSASDIDRYLMMHGKALKMRRIRNGNRTKAKPSTNPPPEVVREFRKALDRYGRRYEAELSLALAQNPRKVRRSESEGKSRPDKDLRPTEGVRS